MAKSKPELLEEAKKLKLEVTAKNTIAELTAAIKAAGENPEAEPAREAKAAKAGKRSAKGQAEAEAKVEKIEHQQHRDEEDDAEAKPKQPVKPTRTRLERRSNIDLRLPPLAGRVGIAVPRAKRRNGLRRTVERIQSRLDYG